MEKSTNEVTIKESKEDLHIRFWNKLFTFQETEISIIVEVFKNYNILSEKINSYHKQIHNRYFNEIIEKINTKSSVVLDIVLLILNFFKNVIESEVLSKMDEKKIIDIYELTKKMNNSIKNDDISEIQSLLNEMNLIKKKYNERFMVFEKLRINMDELNLEKKKINQDAKTKYNTSILVKFENKFKAKYEEMKSLETEIKNMQDYFNSSKNKAENIFQNTVEKVILVSFENYIVNYELLSYKSKCLQNKGIFLYNLIMQLRNGIAEDYSRLENNNDLESKNIFDKIDKNKIIKTSIDELDENSSRYTKMTSHKNFNKRINNQPSMVIIYEELRCIFKEIDQKNLEKFFSKVLFTIEGLKSIKNNIKNISEKVSLNYDNLTSDLIIKNAGIFYEYITLYIESFIEKKQAVKYSIEFFESLCSNLQKFKSDIKNYFMINLSKIVNDELLTKNKILHHLAESNSESYQRFIKVADKFSLINQNFKLIYKKVKQMKEEYIPIIIKIKEYLEQALKDFKKGNNLLENHIKILSFTNMFIKITSENNKLESEYFNQYINDLTVFLEIQLGNIIEFNKRENDMIDMIQDVDLISNFIGNHPIFSDYVNELNINVDFIKSSLIKSFKSKSYSEILKSRLLNLDVKEEVNEENELMGFEYNDLRSTLFDSLKKKEHREQSENHPSFKSNLLEKNSSIKSKLNFEIKSNFTRSTLGNEVKNKDNNVNKSIFVKDKTSEIIEESQRKSDDNIIIIDNHEYMDNNMNTDNLGSHTSSFDSESSYSIANKEEDHSTINKEIKVKRKISNNEENILSKFYDLDRKIENNTNNNNNEIDSIMKEGLTKKTSVELQQEEKLFGFYNCAYVEDMLLQGHLYITNLKIFFKSWFNSKTFIGKTLLEIPYNEIQSIEKTKYLKIFDNSIEIKTKIGSILFTSFVNRDKCFKFLEENFRQFQEKHVKENNENKVKDDNNDDKIDSLNTSFNPLKVFKKAIKETTFAFIKQLEEVTLSRYKKFEELKFNIQDSNCWENKKKNFVYESKKKESFKAFVYDKEYISSLPAYFLVKLMFDESLKHECMGYNDNFWTSIFKMRKCHTISRYNEIQDNGQSKKISFDEYLETQKMNILMDLSNITVINKNSINIKKILEKDKYLDEQNTTTFDEIIKDISLWGFNPYIVNYKYITPLRKRMFVPDESRLKLIFFINIISPTLIIVDEMSQTYDIAYSSSFYTRNQYKFESKITYEDGFLKFKTYLSSFLDIVFVESCFIQSIIESEGIKEGPEAIKLYNFEGILKLIKENEPLYNKQLQISQQKQFKYIVNKYHSSLNKFYKENYANQNTKDNDNDNEIDLDKNIENEENNTKKISNSDGEHVINKENTNSEIKLNEKQKHTIMIFFDKLKENLNLESIIVLLLLLILCYILLNLKEIKFEIFIMIFLVLSLIFYRKISNAKLTSL